MTRDAIPTPALILNAAVVRRNIQRLQDYFTQHNLKLRPHTKTHKSIRLARMQLDAGAVGLTVAKVGEAEVMAEVSSDILVAYPAADPARARALATLAKRVTLRVAVDSARAVESLAAAATAARSEIGILVDIDIGMHRTGVQSTTAALELAQLIDRTPNVRLDGLFCYPGHIATKPDEQAPALKLMADTLNESLRLFATAGLPCPIVSGGSTPTAYQSHLVPQLTEIRPGTYIFNDMNTVRGGYCTLDDCAARIVCTVVSDAVPGKVVLDAGSKTLTSDRCGPAPDSGHGYIVEYPRAKITRLTEEHGEVDITACDRAPKIGERVTVIPNHICPCVNLQDCLWWDEGGGELEALRVDARGRLS